MNKQEKQYRHDYGTKGEEEVLIVNLRFDDRHKNGHDTFAITADRYGRDVHRGGPTVKHKSGKTLWLHSCGCLHDEIRKVSPNLERFIKWHLTSTEGPMYYIEDTLCNAGHTGKYTANPPDLEAVKHCMVWGALPEDVGNPPIDDKAALVKLLERRRGPLMEAFKADMLALGFEYPDKK